MRLPQQAAGDAEQAVHVSQIPQNSGDTSVLFADWTEAYKADEHLKELYEYLSAGNSRAGFGVYRGKIRKNGKILVPTSLVDMVVKAMHSFAHPGVGKLNDLCLRKFAIP